MRTVLRLIEGAFQKKSEAEKIRETSDAINNFLIHYLEAPDYALSADQLANATSALGVCAGKWLAASISDMPSDQKKIAVNLFISGLTDTVKIYEKV